MARFVDPSKPMVALTYDDGPGLKSEDKIHDVLEKYDAVATFFYSGYMVKGKEDRLKRSVENGCEIGSHTWDHPVLTSCDKKELKKQLNKTNKTIKKACGQAPVLFRPSYGITNKEINKKAKLPVIMWDIDTKDWKTRDAKKIYKSVIKRHKKNKLDGKIVLMHCIYDETADATAKIVPWLDAHGYQMVTVSELYKYGKGKELKPGKVYP
ncbi:MAG: polysaccharide deacetylase family protein [Firmicutes bacterium]|nr:polysaccharide deacetylase family protein [Bacillota bacterium]